ncbi:hypothetical protein AGMMS50293_24240 [Spirochaetia bacterium]|nr:hypothetical protein AGMMS50293_24240 [Spirochaetia bacterium]
MGPIPLRGCRQTGIEQHSLGRNFTQGYQAISVADRQETLALMEKEYEVFTGYLISTGIMK